MSFAQQIETNAKSPKPLAVSKKQKEADKKKAKQAAKIERAEAKARKDHMKIQDKATRKRMKKSRQEANRNNSNKREFFLKRWFSHKH